MSDEADGQAPDIAKLLAIALDDEPSRDLAEPVMRRLAAVKTAVELGRLFGVAPIHELIDELRREDDGEDADEVDRDAGAGDAAGRDGEEPDDTTD